MPRLCNRFNSVLSAAERSSGGGRVAMVKGESDGFSASEGVGDLAVEESRGRREAELRG